jgi:hypothetical protein
LANGGFFETIQTGDYKMNDLQQAVIDRAKEWYYAIREVEDGAPINWISENEKELEAAIADLVAEEEFLDSLVG